LLLHKKTNERKLMDSVKTIMIIPGADDSFDALCTIRLDEFSENILTGVSSHIGRRDYQQDATKVYVDNLHSNSLKTIAVLCDGMGGLNGGELASNLCVEKIYEDFYAADVLENVSEFFKSSIQNLDRLVCGMTDEQQKPVNAGTTLASIIIIDNNLFWASVGDSRIYLIRNNEIAQITEDHNYMMLLKERVKRGYLTQEEADTHPKREALISYIGMDGVKYIDANSKPFKLEDGDIILICSDGLYRTLEDDEILHIIQSQQSEMNTAARALTELAIGKGKKNQDNTAAVLIKYRD